MTNETAQTSRQGQTGAKSRRLTREDWIAFARRTLVKSGIESVKVDRLANAAKVTRGSFYWHFKNRNDLLDALLRDWEVRNLVEVAEIRDSWNHRDPDLAEVIGLWVGEDSRFLDFDIAIRAWARQSSQVADTVRRVDNAWIGLLEVLFSRAGYAADDSLVRARITYFHQVGYHVLAFREDPAERLRLVPAYYRALAGKEPGNRLAAILSDLGTPARKR